MLSLSARVRPATIKIRQVDGSVFEIQASRIDTIFSLKEQIMRQMFISPQQQRLVFRGKVLCDDMTLGYYNINPADTVYLAIIQQRNERPKASTLLSRLLELVNTLNESTSSSKFALQVDEINQILDHPVLKSAARINPEIQQILDDAAQVVKTTERPISEKTLKFVAQSQDITFAQFEATPDGYRLLQSVMDEETTTTTDSRASDYSNIIYIPKISEKALPTCWKKKNKLFQNTALSLTPRQSFFERQLDQNPCTWETRPLRKDPVSTLREKFANQLNELKNMGFNDEEVILQALRETGGNVQKAEQLLRNRPWPEC